MGLLVDEYSVAWALRYLREAKADLVEAEKASTSSISVTLSVLSMRKSQAAVYFCLGDPAYLDTIVRFKLEMEEKTSDALMNCLMQIERTIERSAEHIDIYERAKALTEAKHINEVAQELVELITGAKAQKNT